MERVELGCLVILGALLGACGSDVEAPAEAAGASGAGSGGATSSSSSSNTGTGTGTGTGGVGGGATLGGHYMQQQIGDCINGEEWLSFGSSPSFTHTYVNRDFCGPHSVEAAPGTFQDDGAIVEMKWISSSSNETHRYTYALVEYEGAPLSSPFPEYEFGTHAVTLLGYARVGDSLVWHREQHQIYSDFDGVPVYEQHVVVDLELDAPLVDPAGPTACTLTAHVAVENVVDPQKPSEKGDEVFVVPCSYDVDFSKPWIRLAADGIESAYDWSMYLEAQGIWSKYPGQVADSIYYGFLPVLHYVKGHEERMFNDISWGKGWFFEMKNPPPSSVE
jgi:hypothetical protein